MIYEDANVLERVLMAKVRQLGPLPAQDGVANKPRVLRYGAAVGVGEILGGGWCGSVSSKRCQRSFLTLLGILRELNRKMFGDVNQIQNVDTDLGLC